MEENGLLITNKPSEGIFDPGSAISKQSDGSWQIDGAFRPGNKYEDQVRMTVGTSEGLEQMETRRDNRICEGAVSRIRYRSFRSVC